MVAASLEVNDAVLPGVNNPSPDFHALWCDMRKVAEQLSSAGEYADQGAENIARFAALEGVTTLRLALSKWTESPQYREFAATERLTYGDLEQDDAPVIFDKGLMRMCDHCAVEVRECAAIPPAVREQLHDRLREAAQYGAPIVAAVLAQAAIAERVLKAKAH